MKHLLIFVLLAVAPRPSFAAEAASAAFPDYELTDHTGKRRKAFGPTGPDPMVWCVSRGRILPEGSAPGRGSTRNTYEVKEGK